MIYFDNAATTLKKPDEVIQAVIKGLNLLGNAGRGSNSVSLSTARAIYDARVNISSFFGIDDASRLAFTYNSTEALNIAIKGVFNSGDHIITTVLEHNSVLRPLYEIEKNNISVTYIEADRYGNPLYEDIEGHIRENTRAIICTHSSNLTGNLVDIEKIGNICKKHNLIFILDASQTAGTFPIDVKKNNIDILCFTGHKSLYGPQGTGGIYVGHNVNIRPFKSGGTGIATYSHTQPKEMPTLLEAGTLNGHGIVGLSAGIDFIKKIGIDNIRQHEQKLLELIYNEVSKLEGITIYGDFTSFNRSPIFTFNIKDYDSGDIAQELLDTYGIVCRSGGHCAPLMHQSLGTVEQGTIRFSFSYFNTVDEIKYAISALKTISEL